MPGHQQNQDYIPNLVFVPPPSLKTKRKNISRERCFEINDHRKWVPQLRPVQEQGFLRVWIIAGTANMGLRPAIGRFPSVFLTLSSEQRCISSCRLSKQITTNSVTQKAEVYFLKALKARSVKSRYQQGRTPSKALCFSPPCLFQFLMEADASWLGAAYLQSLPPFSHHFLLLSFFLPYRYLCHWIQASSTIFSEIFTLITTAKNIVKLCKYSICTRKGCVSYRSIRSPL